MKVFISWSGARSLHIARSLRHWLRIMIQATEPWMSREDISAGSRWSPEIAKQLDDSQFGILVLTPENSESSWLNFEAGAIAKSLKEKQGFVCPYLYDMEPADVPNGPLKQFQAKKANEDETLELVMSINACLEGKALNDQQLEELFNMLWPQLKRSLDETPASTEPAMAKRSQGDILEEILETTRRLDQAMSTGNFGFGGVSGVPHASFMSPGFGKTSFMPIFSDYAPHTIWPPSIEQKNQLWMIVQEAVKEVLAKDEHDKPNESPAS